MNRRKYLPLLIFGVLLIGFAVAEWNDPGRVINRADRVGSPKEEELLLQFEALNPGREVIKYAAQDLNEDGRLDLVVIYRVSPEKNMMRIVLDLGGQFTQTNEVPAPYSTQVISFRDIDNKPPMEIVVQGTKGAKFGYAIYRVEGTRLDDLFGEGMEGCC